MPSGEPALPHHTARWSADELIPFGKYILLNKISAGATAVAYRAKLRGEAGFERIVAVKRILPQMAGDTEFVETFVREAKICARLTHGSICPIYELGKVGESLYMASQLVTGKDLGAIMRRLQFTGKVMPPLAAAWIGSRLCDALDYAHGLKDTGGERLGILHQDLSPANIVVSYEGEVKLIDFGVARASGQAQQTNVEALKQKIGYMSPELVRGAHVDARTDVFGVGISLYEMVTGRRLFAGSDDIATLKLVSHAVVPPPSALLDDTPEELEVIIMRALARDPEARWPSAGEMAHALTACVAAEDPTFGTRNIGELMRELFVDDQEAEQRKLHELIVASQDAQLMEQRRRFFASPLGAAAVAKAEAARRLASTRPPPASVSVAPPVTVPPVAAQPEDEELTTYRQEQRPDVRATRSSVPDAGSLTRAATYEELTQGNQDQHDPSKLPTPLRPQSQNEAA
ncbi:MAG: serine/threonine-protein kinase, partial [Polyangiales bacterium]